MTLIDTGSRRADISDGELAALFTEAVEKALWKTGLVWRGRGTKVIILPPDISRLHSRGGLLAAAAYKSLSAKGFTVSLLPALGTHMPLTREEQERMFPGVPESAFIVHDWRRDAAEMDRIEAAWLEKVSEGRVSYDWPIMTNRRLLAGQSAFVISIGQVVPHEVAGMANHAKNLFVGTGGKEAIDKSHFLGAAWGMERLLGKADNPVRALFDEGLRRCGDLLAPVLYGLTVVGSRDAEDAPGGPHAVRGLFAGFGRECFEKAAALSRQVNIDVLKEPVRKAVVYLDPEEFRTTWIGNKAIYRTRMAMADGGELLILAPGLERFGEDKENDKRIRRYGYRGTQAVLDLVKSDSDLAANLGVAAHLIHGSSEGRFTIRYCPGPGVSREEIEGAGFQWGSLEEALAAYPPERLSLGPQTVNGEDIFFVPNPALGLWSTEERFGGV